MCSAASSPERLELSVLQRGLQLGPFDISCGEVDDDDVVTVPPVDEEFVDEEGENGTSWGAWSGGSASLQKMAAMHLTSSSESLFGCSAVGLSGSEYSCRSCSGASVLLLLLLLSCWAMAPSEVSDALLKLVEVLVRVKLCSGVGMGATSTGESYDCTGYFIKVLKRQEIPSRTHDIA